MHINLNVAYHHTTSIMPSKKAPCTCPSCNGTMRDAKTVKKHMANQVAAQSLKTSYVAQWQDLYTQAKHNDAKYDLDDGGPGLEGFQSGGSTAEDLQRPVKRRCIIEGEISPAVVTVRLNVNILFFCRLFY